MMEIGGVGRQGGVDINFISYLSYNLHCCMLPDKHRLSHSMCLYQVMMMLHFFNDTLMMLNLHNNKKLRHNH